MRTVLLRFSLATIILVWFATRVFACDICAPMPGTPFQFDHPAAIELAQAAWSAVEAGQIELNPGLLLSEQATAARQEMRLDDLTGRQLLHHWSQATNGRLPPGIRMTLDVQFVDTGEICGLDLRCGQIIARDRTSGPAEMRLVTTKSGWHALQQLGLKSCETLQLLILDRDSGMPASHAAIARLFPGEPLARSLSARAGRPDAVQ